MQTQYLEEFQKKGYFTPWFKREVNPSKPGVYLTALGTVDHQTYEFWQYWDGVKWHTPQYQINDCLDMVKNCPMNTLNVWCGLTQEGYDYAKKLVLMEVEVEFTKAVKKMQEGKKMSSSIMNPEKEYVYYDSDLEQFMYTYSDSNIYTTYIFDLDDILNRDWVEYKGEE